MAESGQEQQFPLSERFDRYRVEIQKIVERGIEHPRYELKRAVTVSKENLADRLDFIKLIQGLANAHIAEERFIVIGADQKECKFYNVENVREFDQGDLSQIIKKYLDPVPQLEVFNNVRADSGESYVLIVVAANQPRPVVAITEGKSDKKTHFSVGNIWIKKDTSLQPATRGDIDQMYEIYIRRRVDEEAEPRARRRFEHFREEFGSSFALPPAAVSVPSSDLIVGERGRLTKFAETTISSENSTNFKMFIEMVRERLIDKWSPLESAGTLDIEKWSSKRAEVYQDEFVPALDSVVDVGLLIVKYDVSSEWFGIVVKQLMAAFEACRNVDRRTANIVIQAGKPLTPSIARPAYDVYIAIRTLAIYAVMRERYRFLKEILPHYFHPVTPNEAANVSMPVLFWPFSGIAGFPDMRQGGRNKSFWDAHIHAAWGQFFGTEERFLSAASQLEFILEFNSYVFVGVKIPEVQKLQGEALSNVYFPYLPDFWVTRLDPALPMAERFYEILNRTDEFPAEFAIDKRATDLVFKGKTAQQRLLFLGCFLEHLRSWQAQMMMEQNRFPFMFEWQGRLKQIVEKCKQAKATKEASR